MPKYGRQTDSRDWLCVGLSTWRLLVDEAFWRLWVSRGVDQIADAPHETHAATAINAQAIAQTQPVILTTTARKMQ